jgi:D-tyrosyl-tRNA(Tyr) deacylase
MRAIIQRVQNASVSVNEKVTGQISRGLLVFLGIGENDTNDDIKYIIDKTINLRIFSDSDDKMNLSLRDINGQILLVSQFTLYGDCRKGRRPSFDSAMRPKEAESLYETFIAELKKIGICAETGIFGADMQVSLTNDGPVTIMLDSRKLF